LLLGLLNRVADVESGVPEFLGDLAGAPGAAQAEREFAGHPGPRPDARFHEPPDPGADLDSRPPTTVGPMTDIRSSSN
jgi:hypothetical protein